MSSEEDFESKALLFLRRELTIMKWVEEILETEFQHKQQFHLLLKNGVILCQLMEALKPNSIPIVLPSNYEDLVSPSLSKRYIEFFLEACQEYGVPTKYLFSYFVLQNVESEEEEGGTLIPESVVDTLEMLGQIYDQKETEKGRGSRLKREKPNFRRTQSLSDESSHLFTSVSEADLSTITEEGSNRYQLYLSAGDSSYEISSPTIPSPRFSEDSEIATHFIPLSSSSFSIPHSSSYISGHSSSFPKQLPTQSSLPKLPITPPPPIPSYSPPQSPTLSSPSFSPPSTPRTPEQTPPQSPKTPRSLTPSTESMSISTTSSASSNSTTSSSNSSPSSSITNCSPSPPPVRNRAKSNFKRITTLVQQTPLPDYRVELAKKLFVRQEQKHHKKTLQKKKLEQERKERLSKLSFEDSMILIQKEKESCSLLIQKTYRGHLARVAYRKKVRNAAYRQKVANEILSSEKQYVENISLIVTIFLEPLEKFESENKPIITKDQIRSIFSDIKTILNFNQKLLEELEPRVLDWSPIQCLGSIFLKITDFLKVYTQYVKNYNVSLTVQNDLKKKNPKFAAFMKERSRTKQMTRHELTSLLIMPIQRIPRYELLLKELVKHTKQDHPDFENLSLAAKKIGEVAVYVNQRKSEADNLAKVYEIQSSFTGKIEDLPAPHRRFVKEGILDVLDNDGKKGKRVVYLFNDILLVGKTSSQHLFGSFISKKFTVKLDAKLSLNELTLVDAANPTKKTEFGLMVLQPGPGSSRRTYRFYCESPDQKTEWLNDILKVISEAAFLKQQKDEFAFRRAQAKAAETKNVLNQQYSTLKNNRHNRIPTEKQLSINTKGSKSGPVSPVTSPVVSPRSYHLPPHHPSTSGPHSPPSSPPSSRNANQSNQTISLNRSTGTIRRPPIPPPPVRTPSSAQISSKSNPSSPR